MVMFHAFFIGMGVIAIALVAIWFVGWVLFYGCYKLLPRLFPYLPLVLTLAIVRAAQKYWQ